MLKKIAFSRFVVVCLLYAYEDTLFIIIIIFQTFLASLSRVAKAAEDDGRPKTVPAELKVVARNCLLFI